MNKKLIILLILALLFIAAPFLLAGFWVRLVTYILMFSVLASALNIISGFTGYAAFGNMVFFGVGAYTTAVFMSRLNMPFPVALIASLSMAILMSMLLGMLLLRLKGHYFALGSLGAAEAVKFIIDNMTDLTGGGQGITLPQMKGSPAMANTAFYFMMFALLVIILIVSWRLSKNRLGYAFKSIRANEEAAGVMGIDTTKYKIMSWSLSAIFTGVTGSIYAYWFSYIDPPTVFDVMWVVKMFVMILIGGAGTVFGPVIGAFILETISELVWSRFLNLHLGILGTIIILVVLFMPDGLISMVTRGKGVKDLMKQKKTLQKESADE
ncbi:MAG: branched-chain amino acid ABC transporter permease [Spirochaetales bacterium]|nr:branched-chain amino acid ABC transporter permease [Spirochaetales bacterium]